MSWRTQRIFSHRAILHTFPAAELRACSITSGVVVVARGADRTLARIFFKRDRRIGVVAAAGPRRGAVARAPRRRHRFDATREPTSCIPRSTAIPG